MSNFEITYDWLASGNDVPEIRQTMAQLTLRAGGLVLTQNEDIWSRTVRDSVLVSAYPLAMWLEAEMGYEPDECPDEVLQQARELAGKMGEATLSEILPIDGKAMSATPLANIQAMIAGPGLIGKINIPKIVHSRKGTLPWQRAVADARTLRKEMGITEGKISDAKLCDLLELRPEDVAGYAPEQRGKAALAMPGETSQTKFLLRKRRPVSKRFELARVIADAQSQTGKHHGKPWLAVTDIATARQKYQRAFAAEFLCPIDELVQVLEDDYSDENIGNAAGFFDVSEQTVNALLLNNGKLYRADDGPYRTQGPELPYAVAAW